LADALEVRGPGTADSLEESGFLDRGDDHVADLLALCVGGGSLGFLELAAGEVGVTEAAVDEFQGGTEGLGQATCSGSTA
jgi:hypothetical protein